jgi:sugar transferase (PEP-CTERM system associated)
MFFLAMDFGSDARFLFTKSWYTQKDITMASAIFSFVLTTSCAGLGLYRRSLSQEDYALMARACISFLIAILSVILIYYLMPEFFIARSVLWYAVIFAFTGMMLTRYIFYRVASNESLNRKVLIIGSGHKAQKLISVNEAHFHKGFHIVGFIALPDEEPVVEKSLIIKTDKTINEVTVEYKIDEIVIALDDKRRGMPLDDLLDCKMSGMTILDMMAFYEREKGIISLEDVYPSWLVFSDGFAQGGIRAIEKRFFDILASLLLLFAAWPIMLCAALAIKFECAFKGPIFYRQVRVGNGNKNFNVLKFRSMRVDAERNGAQWAQKKDSRVTRVGNFIRKYRIDELPQIFNVLNGDMSFVGPRPERPEFVKGFNERIPYYCERHRVKPGITGWAQLCYPYGADEHDTIQKLQYDLYYVKNYSLFLDLSIMLSTVEVILWGKGAR